MAASDAASEGVSDAAERCEPLREDGDAEEAAEAPEDEIEGDGSASTPLLLLCRLGVGVGVAARESMLSILVAAEAVDAEANLVAAALTLAGPSLSEVSAHDVSAVLAVLSVEQSDAPAQRESHPSFFFDGSSCRRAGETAAATELLLFGDDCICCAPAVPTATDAAVPFMI